VLEESTRSAVSQWLTIKQGLIETFPSNLVRARAISVFAADEFTGHDPPTGPAIGRRIA
jgi:hypothetical protein